MVGSRDVYDCKPIARHLVDNRPEVIKGETLIAQASEPPLSVLYRLRT